MGASDSPPGASPAPCPWALPGLPLESSILCTRAHCEANLRDGGQGLVEECTFRSLEAAVEREVGAEHLTEYGDLLCSEGYKGNLCGVCQSKKEEKWGLKYAFLCVQCRGREGVVFAISVALVSGLLFFVTVINLNNNRVGFRNICYPSDISKVRSGWRKTGGTAAGVGVRRFVLVFLSCVTLFAARVCGGGTECCQNFRDIESFGCLFWACGTLQYHPLRTSPTYHCAF